MNKKLKIFFITLFSIITILFLAIYIFLYSKLAKIDGEIKINNLTEKVFIYRDKNGVPSIVAKNDLDLYRAQGFIQAQDRLFQMDLARRQASGRLSEIVGEVALDNDKKFLVFSLRKAAEESLKLYSGESKEILDAFADGVNQYIDYAIKNNKLPYEFSLLGYKPEKWSPVDSLVIGKYMAYDLGGHWNYQIFNNWVLNNLGEEKLKEFLPENFYLDPNNLEILKLNKETTLAIDSKLANIELPYEENGSNNWVISPKKSETSNAILADDPHLSLNLPSIWYQMHLKSDNVDVSGVIFTGIPGIILGHNQDIAWGVTNVGPDVQDIYIEKINPNNPHQLEYDGKYYDAEIVTHNIKVKGKEDVKFEIIYSKNGPIIDELVKSINTNFKFSMRWTAFEASKELEAIIGINKAKNWEEFEKSLLNFKTPAQNFVYADKSGFIAYKANGLIPIRNKGNANLPVPGYLSEYAWKGFIDFDKLPKIINPESGYIHTANTDTVKDYPYHLSNIWAQSYRYDRINEVLSSKEKLNVEDMKNLQVDIKNLYPQEFLPHLLKYTNIEDEKIKSILENWDYFDKVDSIASLIFDTWMIKIREEIYAKNLDENVYKFMPNKEFITDRILRNYFNGKSSILIDEAGGIENILNTSFEKTIVELKEKFGNDYTKWRWGLNHKTKFFHPLAKNSKLLDKFLNTKETEIGGSRTTVFASKQNENGYVTHGASWRFVYDFSTNTAYHTVAPGQNGHFMSKYYINQLDIWNNWKHNIKDTNNIDKTHTLILSN